LVLVSAGARLTDADVYDGRLIGVDNLHNVLVTLGTAATLSRHRAHAYRATSACPRS
jgi:hypothetical protein